MVAKGFLKLPVELRLKVYEHITSKVPYTDYLNEYDGLRLSCRLVKREIDHECASHFSKYFAELPGSATIRIFPLRTFHIGALQHLTVQLTMLYPVVQQIWYEIHKLKLRALTVQMGPKVVSRDLNEVLRDWKRVMEIVGNQVGLKDMTQRIVLQLSRKGSPTRGWTEYAVSRTRKPEGYELGCVRKVYHTYMPTFEVEYIRAV